MIDPNSTEHQQALAWFKNTDWYGHFPTHNWVVKLISGAVGTDLNNVPVRVIIARCKDCSLYASLSETSNHGACIDGQWFDDEEGCQDGKDSHYAIPHVPCNQMRFARNNKAFI